MEDVVTRTGPYWPTPPVIDKPRFAMSKMKKLVRPRDQHGRPRRHKQTWVAVSSDRDATPEIGMPLPMPLANTRISGTTSLWLTAHHSPVLPAPGNEVANGRFLTKSASEGKSSILRVGEYVFIPYLVDQSTPLRYMFRRGKVPTI